MKPLLTNVTFEEMQAFLTDPLSRIIDSRMLETGDDFGFTLQLLHTDNTISQVEVKAKYTANPDGTLTYEGNYQKDALELFRLQYRNSPRMNPALYGLLDAADAESRVENTLPIQTR